MTDISQHIAQVQQRIIAAAEAVNRDPVEITLLAISKNRPIEDIVAAIAAGQRHFGENYLQDALAKITLLENDYPNLEWHFIGAIQSNKTKEIASHFSWVHTVERLKIAQRLNDQRPENLPPIQVCIQINISGEESKAGIPAERVMALATEMAKLPNLKLRGLMAIPAATTELTAQRHAFATLRMLYEKLNKQGLTLDTLSMGMSGDLEAAIAEGSTLVRIGTAIFGARA